MNLPGLINTVCDRIEKLEPSLQALLPETGRRARLLKEAEESEKQFQPESRPPLFGVLVGVKDIFRVNGFPTRAGSELPEHLFRGAEAVCVEKIRAAGAIVLGKTVTTEFAYCEPGPTRNPWNLDHTPGGSSSGSSVSVAAGYCPLALGTQTIGSIVRPAAYCGIIGFKPSYGRIQTEGVIPFSQSADHVGLLAKDFGYLKTAAKILLDDWHEREENGRPVLGVPEGPYLQQASPEALELFRSQVEKLEQKGYTVIKVAVLDRITEINSWHYSMIAAEFAGVHREWFRKYESLYRPRTREFIIRGGKIPDERLEFARQERKNLRRSLERAMDRAGINIWICPSTPGPAPKGLGSTGDPVMNLPWTYAGLPAISIPAGRSKNGLPVGLQCVGRFMDDEYLIDKAEKLNSVFDFQPWRGEGEAD